MGTSDTYGGVHCTLCSRCHTVLYCKLPSRRHTYAIWNWGRGTWPKIKIYGPPAGRPSTVWLWNGPAGWASTVLFFKLSCWAAESNWQAGQGRSIRRPDEAAVGGQVPLPQFHMDCVHRWAINGLFRTNCESRLFWWGLSRKEHSTEQWRPTYSLGFK